MKKLTSTLLSGLLLCGMLGTGASHTAAANAASSPLGNMTVLFNEKPVVFTHQPVLNQNRLLVPLETLAKEIGATITYDQARKTVKIIKGSNIYLLPIGSMVATLNGSTVSLDVPAALINQVPFVPIRFVSENLGLEVGYNQETRTVTLKANDDPSFKVLFPSQDNILYTDQMKISVASFNYELADFRQHMQPQNGQGHIHLWLDTDSSNPKLAYKMINGEPAVFENVQPGPHTLTVQLVGNDHKPIAPAVKKVVYFKTAVHPTQKSTSKTDAKLTNPEKTYKVDIESFAFKPGSLTVEVGTTVTFKNLDDVDHTVTAKDESFDSGKIGKGKTYTMTFKQAGEYNIYCKPHNFMVGTITVK